VPFLTISSINHETMNNFSDEVFYLILDREVKIRGRYLRFSANVEGQMARSVIFLNEVKSGRAGVEQRLDLKNFMFKQKLTKFQSLLLEIYPDLFQSYLELFRNIDKFREMRNKMAHCYFQWDDKNLDSVIIWDLDDSRGVQKMEPYIFTLKEIDEILKQAMTDIIDNINNLSTVIIQRVKPEIPHMF
jgi:hypothetical protein